MEIKYITRMNYSYSQISMSNGILDLYLDTPLTFTEYPGGIVFEIRFFGLAATNGGALYTRVIGKNASNQTVILPVSYFQVAIDPEANRPYNEDYMFPYQGARLTVNADGTGILARVAITTYNSFGQSVKPSDSSNSAITQVLGLRLVRSPAYGIYSRGGYFKAYGLKQ